MNMTMQPVTIAQQQAVYAAINGEASGVDGTSVSETDGSSPPAYLTPVALMAYVQTRLQGIDSQVQTAMTQQQNADWEQSSIGNVLAEIATYSSNTTNGVMNS